MTEPKKELIKYDRLSQFQTSWSLDKFIKDLDKLGVDVCLRVTRGAANEVNISISTCKSLKAYNRITELLYELYGIS